jgi:hypothetical protein
VKIVNPMYLTEPVYLGPSGFRKLFQDCISGFLNPLNKWALSLKTLVAFRKIGINKKRFLEAILNKYLNIEGTAKKYFKTRSNPTSSTDLIL